MAFETITNVTGTYIDTVKPMPKQTESNGTVDISIDVATTEIPTVSRTTQSNQDGANANSEEQKNDEQAEKKLRNAVSEANNKLKGKRTGCEFTYHEESKRVSIKVIDKDTKEVIREIPPEESIEMIEKIWELAGILVDERR
jgi:flagellar protein FlaG